MSRTEPATATVTQVAQVPMPLSEGLVASVLDIAFTTADGARVTTVLPYGYGTPPGEGETIEIRYDPRRPDDVERRDRHAPDRPPGATGLLANGLTQGQWISILAVAAGSAVLTGGVLAGAGHDPQTVFLGVVAMAVLAGFAVARQQRRQWLRKHGIRVTGVVLGFQWHIVDTGGRRRRRRIPIVAFTTPGGAEVTAPLPRAEPGMARGQHVELVHPPERPAQAVLASTLTGGNAEMWQLIGFGAVFVVLIAFPGLWRWISDLRLPANLLDSSSSDTPTRLILGLVLAGAGYYALDGAVIRHRLRHRPGRYGRLGAVAGLLAGVALILAGVAIVVS